MTTHPNDAAFSRPETYYQYLNNEISHIPGTDGLTKREHMATQIAAALFAKRYGEEIRDVAEDVVEMADALINALNIEEDAPEEEAPLVLPFTQEEINTDN